MSFDCEAPVALPSGKTQGKARRIHACKCMKGKYWSLTIRQGQADGLSDPPDWTNAAPERTEYTAGTDPKSFLSSFAEICGALYTLMFAKRGIATSGLVVITGATGSGKSNIVRGLIDLYIRDKTNRAIWYQRGRIPHLVTYEDPIENDLWEHPERDAARHWLDYTPRQKGIDVENLNAAILSALRQTPAVFYVGEVRDIEEWKALLEFAGTGHLIFTTAHAGSLVEAMGKIFAATRAKNAARRAIVADRLAALVHLRRDHMKFQRKFDPRDGSLISISKEGGDAVACKFARNIIIPALWRQTVAGAKALMSEGQSSLLPHSGCFSDSQSCFGRSWFAEDLWSRAETRPTENDKIGCQIRATLREQIGRDSGPDAVQCFREDLSDKCAEWDLEGL